MESNAIEILIRELADANRKLGIAINALQYYGLDGNWRINDWSEEEPAPYHSFIGARDDPHAMARRCLRQVSDWTPDRTAKK